MVTARPLPLLHATLLRSLGVDPEAHPRGRAHLSAASGLVCAHGHAYVVADDEHHLGVYGDLRRPGILHRIASGNLPHDARARKRRKRDFESLFLLPGHGHADRLVTLGSASLANRRAGVVVALDSRGVPQPEVQPFDLAPLTAPLVARFGAINIKGAFVNGMQFVLINRAADDNAGNLSLHYPLRALHDAIDGARSEIAPAGVRTHALGRIDGVELGFTDAAPMPDGGWIYSAAAENRSGSVSDGPCNGSVIGIVDANGVQQAQRALATPMKIEGLAVRSRAGGLDLCLVSDADDPDQPSCLLRTRW